MQTKYKRLNFIRNAHRQECIFDQRESKKEERLKGIVNITSRGEEIRIGLSYKISSVEKSGRGRSSNKLNKKQMTN